MLQTFINQHWQSVVFTLAILVGTILIAFIFNRLFRRFIDRSTIIIRNDPTNYHFLRHVLTALIYIIGLSVAVYSVPSLRTFANSLLAGAGILAVAVGFASQHALSNIISGIFIVIFKPFRVNDRLRLRNTLSGTVEDITLRHVVIRDFENRRILIPNSVISEEIIINSDFEDDRVCQFFELDISYDSDVDLAKAIIREEAYQHPNLLDNRSPEDIAKGVEQVVIRLVNFGDSGVRLRAYLWAADTTAAFAMSCDLRESIKKKFEASGIEIPFPYRTIVYKTPKSDPPTATHDQDQPQ